MAWDGQGCAHLTSSKLVATEVPCLHAFSASLRAAKALKPRKTSII